MESRISSFKESLKVSIERWAPLWVLYRLAGNTWDVQRLEERIYGNPGGKSYAVKEILL